MDNCPKNDGQTSPCVANVRAPRETSHIPVRRPLNTRAYTAVPEKKGGGAAVGPFEGWDCPCQTWYPYLVGVLKTITNSFLNTRILKRYTQIMH